MTCRGFVPSLSMESWAGNERDKADEGDEADEKGGRGGQKRTIEDEGRTVGR